MLLYNSSVLFLLYYSISIFVQQKGLPYHQEIASSNPGDATAIRSDAKEEKSAVLSGWEGHSGRTHGH